MTWLFWISATVVAYAYIGYPVVIYLWSRVRFRPWTQEPVLPHLSIVMAVRNEGECVEKKIENLLGLDYPADHMEIIIVSDGSTDSTNAVLSRYASDRFHAILLPKSRGKAGALNVAIGRATGEIVVFVDARQRIDEQALRYLVSNFSDETVGCAGGKLVFAAQGAEKMARDGLGIYWAYEQGLRNCEARVDSFLGASGALYAARRELLGVIPDGMILDDMYFPLHVIREGYRSVLDMRATCWDVAEESFRKEFQRKKRTMVGNFQLLQHNLWLLTPRNRVMFQFVSHKGLRLLVPFCLLALLLSSWWLAAQPFYLAMGTVQTLFYAMAGLGLRVRTGSWGRVLSVPVAFCLMNAAALVGLVTFLTNRDPSRTVWNSPAAKKGDALERGVKETMYGGMR